MPRGKPTRQQAAHRCSSSLHANVCTTGRQRGARPKRQQGRMIGLEANINVWSNSKTNKSTCAASAWSMSQEPSAAILRGTRLLPIRNTGSMARLLPICTPGSMAPPVHPIRTTDRRSNSTQHCAAVLWVPLRPSRLSSAAAHVPWFRPLCPGVLTPPGAGSVWRCWAAVLLHHRSRRVGRTCRAAMALT